MLTFGGDPIPGMDSLRITFPLPSPLWNRRFQEINQHCSNSQRPIFTILGEVTYADKTESNPSDIGIRIRINPEMRIWIPDQILALAEFALSECFVCLLNTCDCHVYSINKRLLMTVQQAGEWPVAWGRGHSNGVETDAQIVHHFILLTQHNKPIKPVIRSLRRCVCPTSVVGLNVFRTDVAMASKTAQWMNGQWRCLCRLLKGII